ncbi:transporter substrate-binding domain-containing protein [Aneurinibacillus sp. REN35]|uniref:transporter substrate-binding domain-containing protein n=1 Tax=Aneurinibacillus sp. REN35 TaxID=3237286 RepID=UPI003528990F
MLRIRIVLLFILLTLWLAAVQLTYASPAALQPQAKKTYKIAAEWALPPFSYVTENGSFTGASIAIMDKIAAYHNLSFEYIPMDLERAEKELQAGRIDAIAGLTYSTEKSGLFDFSEPYFTMSDALIIPKEKKQTVKSISDVRGLHVILQNRKPVLDSLLNLRHPTLTVTRNQLSGLLPLLKGRADVFIGNKWTAGVYLQHFKQEDNFIILDEVIEPADFAIAVRKGDDAFLSIINKALTTMKAKGEINLLMDDWLLSNSDVQIIRLQRFIQLLAIVLIATACVLLFIYLWNQRLKKAVQARTEELWQLTHHLQKQRQDIADQDAFKEQILNNIHTGIVTFDTDYTVTSYNLRAKEMLGLTGESIYKEEYPPLIARILTHYKNNAKQRVDNSNALIKLEIDEADQWKVIYYRLLMLHDARKNQTGYLLSMTDRTEEKRLEQKLVMQEKLHALGQLVAGVAHEIRNPLTSIKTFVDLLPTKYNRPAFREAIVEHLPAEINRLNMIVTDLLDYARPRSPSKENYAASALLASLLTLLRVTVEKKHILLEQSCPDDIAFYIDPQQMRQVFLNLLLNAIDAVEETANKKITITVEKKEDTLGQITITDTGVGIQHEQIKRIFEPFYSSKHNGVGLGLPLSYKLIKENDGDIRITSHPGQGTSVIVTLPLHKPEEKS